MAIDFLHEKIRKLKNPFIIDFRIQSDKLPPQLLQEEKSYTGAYIRFCEEILEAFSGIAPGIRFSFDTFALLGAEGLSALSRLLTEAENLGYYRLLDGPQILTPWDAERAAELLAGNEYGCDGLLISPYIGSDALKPFVKVCKEQEKELFVVVRSANKSASELQDLLSGTRLVHGAVAEIVNRYGESIFTRCNYSRICSVASAGSADSLRNLRSQYKYMFLLVDGLDYPSGNMKNCSYAFDRYGYGAAISVGPALTCAWTEAENPNSKCYIEQMQEAMERLKKNILRYISIL